MDFCICLAAEKICVLAIEGMYVGCLGVCLFFVHARNDNTCRRM